MRGTLPPSKRMGLTAPLGGRAAEEECSRPPRAHSRTGAAADPQRWAAKASHPAIEEHTQ